MARWKTGALQLYVGDTGRLPIRPLNDTYLVPEAPTAEPCIALEYRLPAHHRPKAIGLEDVSRSSSFDQLMTHAPPTTIKYARSLRFISGPRVGMLYSGTGGA
eukprot:541888-Prymnesium_polylepis.1